jgi:FkbM family methyltransferase
MSYEFSNGVRLRRSDLMQVNSTGTPPPATPNLHEPVEEEWLIRALEGASVFVDVGAAAGYYSILAKRLRPKLRVVAFEPLPRHADALRANLALNGLERDAVEIREIALSDRTGSGWLADEGFSSGLTDEVCGVAVQLQTMAEALADLGLVDVLKMDIQGAELEVLQHLPDVVQTLLIGTTVPRCTTACARSCTNRGYEIGFDDPSPAMQPTGLSWLAGACGGGEVLPPRSAPQRPVGVLEAEAASSCEASLLRRLPPGLGQVDPLR